MYSDVILAMDGARTFKEHITGLQKILDKQPTDPQLITYIEAVQTYLIPEQRQALKNKMASQTLRLNSTSITVLRQLYSYCQQNVSTGQPQWIVAALNAGWTPPPAKP